MPNDSYQTVRISKEAYEQLRELKFKKNKSFITIINELIDKEYKSMEENKHE